MEDRYDPTIIITIGMILAIIIGMAFVFAGPVQAPERLGSLSNSDLAEAFCTERNNTYEVRGNSDGSETGVCIFPDGTVCDGWEYYTGNCTAAAMFPSFDLVSEPGSSPSIDFCLERNHSFTIRENQEGGLDRVCSFPDGRECDVEAYYLGTCNELSAVVPQTSGTME